MTRIIWKKIREEVRTMPSSFCAFLAMVVVVASLPTASLGSLSTAFTMRRSRLFLVIAASGKASLTRVSTE